MPGVGVVITDDSESEFFIQQKDETYPLDEYRGLYSFFGGSVNPGENEMGALERELKEELEPEAVKIIAMVAKKIGQFAVSANSKDFSYTLFKAKLPTDYVRALKMAKVKEGRGIVVSKKELAHLDFIWGLNGVRDLYLAQYL